MKSSERPGFKSSNNQGKTGKKLNEIKRNSNMKSDSSDREQGKTPHSIYMSRRGMGLKGARINRT